MRDIGKNIKTIRQSKEMTQEALAEALFVTRQTVSNYENGRSRPDLDMLLRIAEVLETDVNTLLYGPPIPQSKKETYKWAMISSGLLLAVWVLYFSAIAIFQGDFFAYIVSGRSFSNLALLPAGMFMLGWVMLHGLHFFGGLKQLPVEKGKIARIVLGIIGCLIFAVPLPMIIFLGVATVRSILENSVVMSFPYIPVYQELFYGIYFIIRYAPFSYSILGGLFWLVGMPRIERKTDREDTSLR